MTSFNNCGFYIPGRQQTGPGLRSSSPRLFIPDGQLNTYTPFENNPPSNSSEERWYCTYLTKICDPPPSVESGSCFECTSVGGVWYPSNELCKYTSLSRCRADCQEVDCIQQAPPGIIFPPSVGGGDEGGGEDATEVYNTNSTPQNPVTPGSIAINTNNSLNSIISQLPQKQKTVIGNEGSLVFRFASPSSTANNSIGVVDPKYTFFNLEPTTNTILVDNTYYTNIFKTSIPREVHYFLRNKGVDYPWSESDLFDLTLDKIALSLNENLLANLNILQYSGGTLVDLKLFLNAIKMLLLSGRIDEFDPNYYAYLVSIQREYNETTFPGNLTREDAKEAALGIISLGFSAADFRSIDPSYPSHQLKRYRTLNTDIEALVPVVEFEGNQSELNLYDAGIKVKELDKDVFDYLELGDGAGYYFSAVNFQGSCLPLPSINQVSITRYVPHEVRYNALKILSIFPGITITAESPSALHEFSDSYDYTLDTEVMYFAMDLESVEDIPTNQLLINNTRVKFKLITGEERDTHVKNYGMNITKVNIDFNDPLLHYIRDTSSFTLSQYDISFRNLPVRRTNVGDLILSRNIPFGIIISPGNGSKHNPFHTMSKVTTYDSDLVVRELNLIPRFLTPETIPERLLPEYRVYDDLNQLFIGEYENRFYQNIDNVYYKYELILDSFQNSYTTTTKIRSPESKLVKLVDTLVSSYDIQFLTWWDVYRRLSLNDIGSLMTFNSKTLRDLISNGWRGVNVTEVLSRIPLITTGINEELLPSDKIYIQESLR